MLIESKTLDGKYFDSMQDFNPETGLGKLKVGRKTLVFVEDSEVGKPYCFFKAASNGQYKFLAKVEGKANAFWLFAEKGSSTVNAPYITEVELEKAGALKKVKEVLKQPQFKSGKKEKDSVWERISPVDENAPKIERVEVKKGQEVRLVDTGKKITDTPQEQIGVADKAKKETAAVLREGQVVAEGSQVIQKNTPSEDLQPAEADIPQSNDNNEEKKQNKKEKSKKENKGGNMKTKKNPVYDENNNEVAQISSDKVGGFEGAIYIIDGVAIGDDGKEGTKLGKWDAKAKAITPIEEKKPNGTRHTVTRTDDGVVRGVVDKAHGKGGFMQDIKNEIETYVQQKVSIKRQDNTAEYTDAEEKKIKGFAKFALDTVVKGKNLSEDEAKVVEARRQEMLDYAERCIKNKFPVEKKEVVIDFDYLAGKIRDRVQKGARMAFTMSDDEKKDIREILANATPEKIRKIAYGDSKKTQGLAHDMINAEEQLAKAGGAIKISGSPELQSVIKNVGIVDNKETKTAHVSINELKNLEGVYYKLGVVPAYASALVDFVVKKYKNPQISEEDKSKLVDIAHELVLSEILTDQDVYALVDDAAMQKSFDSPVHVYAFKAADQFVAAHEEDLVKEGADRDEVVEKWAEYFIKVAQTKRHLNPVVGEVAAMGQLTEDQQNEIIGFVNNYKKLDDIIDLALVTKTPVENKVVVEKVKHIAEKVKMQEKLDSIRTSKTYAGIVDTIKEEAEEAQKVEGCRKSAEEIVNNTVKDGNFTDEEKAQLVENVENMIREDAGLPPKTEENTAAPVVPEEVNEPEQNEPTPSNEEENVPGDVETPENTENEEDQINNVEKPEDTNKPAPENTPDKPENNEKPAKPVDPREVVISDPIKIDGGKRGNYQGVFVLGPHPKEDFTL